MVIITKAEWDEYQELKARYNIDSKVNSARRVINLEDDIDTPVKSAVGMLALLGCRPMWSCCGYDYVGQPCHKSHHYGTCGFTLSDNQETERVVSGLIMSGSVSFQAMGNGWRLKAAVHYGNQIVWLTSDLKTGNTWPDTDSIHYSEPAVIALGLLKRYLYTLKNEFLDTVILSDTNDLFKRRFSDWQYPALESWTINKEDILALVEDELGD